MQTLWQNLRYGARMLLKRPGFTLMVLLMMQSMPLGRQAPERALVIKDVTVIDVSDFRQFLNSDMVKALNPQSEG